MSNKYKKMQEEGGDGAGEGAGSPSVAPVAAAPVSAPAAAPQSSSRADDTPSAGQPANYAAATEETATSLSQQLMNSLRIDHPFFGQRLQQPEQSTSGGSGETDQQQQQQAAAEPEGRMQTAPPFPFLPQSLPPPRRACKSDDIPEDEARSHGTYGSKPIVPLTRTFSTPETKYRPLHEEGDDHDDGNAEGDEDEENLKQDYPLLLQRSASSAFGSPSKFRPRRAPSNCSDPGASAFQVWR